MLYYDTLYAMLCCAVLGLLTLYLIKPSYAESFKTDALAHRSFVSSFIGVAAIVSPSAINAISQVA